jgi:hypothetical protein
VAIADVKEGRLLLLATFAQTPRATSVEDATAGDLGGARDLT